MTICVYICIYNIYTLCMYLINISHFVFPVIVISSSEESHETSVKPLQDLGPFQCFRELVSGRIQWRCAAMLVDDIGDYTIQSGWWFGAWLLFSHILGIIIPID